MKFAVLNMVEAGDVRYDEDLGREVRDETSKPCVVNAATIRCFYARKDGKPGTRITFNDGGGFAVSDSPHEVARAVADAEFANELTLAASAPAVPQAAN